MEAQSENDSAVCIAHALPGRTRLRIRAAPLASAVAERLGDRLAAVAGVSRVEIDHRTAGVLCTHAPELAPGALLEASREVLSVASREAAEREPAPVPSAAATTVARELHKLFVDMDRDLRRVTDGKLDLGTATTLTFLAAGALEVVATQKLPVPPWFNLAWWGFRTFMTTFQGPAGKSTAAPGPAAPEAAP